MDAELRKLMFSRKENSNVSPVLLIIRLMKRCNVKCQMCDFWKTKDQGFTIETIKEMIDDAKTLGVQEVRLTGGEPTLHQYFFETLEYIRQQGLQASFITNGSTLTGSMCKQILEKKPKHIHVSLDSSKPDFHNWQRGVPNLWQNAVEGIKRLNQYRKTRQDPKIVINCVISKFNYQDIPEIINLSEGKYFEEINFIPIRGQKDWYLTFEQIKEYNTEIVPKIRKALEKNKITLRSEDPFVFGITQEQIQDSTQANYTQSIYRSLKCIVAKYTIFIDEQGRAFPCCNTPYKPDVFSYGNVFEKRLTELYNSEPWKKIQLRTASPLYCNSCEPVYQLANIQNNEMKKLNG